MSETMLFVVFFIPFAVIIIFLLLRTSKKDKEELTKILQPQALQRNGTVKKDPLGYLRLYFSDAGVEVSVKGDKGRGRYEDPSTILETEIVSHKNIKIHVSTEGVFAKLAKAVVGEDIQTGNPEFDKKFLVKGNEPLQAMHLLTLEIQQKLLELEQYSPLIDIKDGIFQFAVGVYFREQQQYDAFIDAGLAVLRQLKYV